MLEHKEAIISHFKLGILFLGFHTLGLYIHNDRVVAFGQPEKQILVEPVFAQWIQALLVKLYMVSMYYFHQQIVLAKLLGNNVWLPGWLDAINNGKTLYS